MKNTLNYINNHKDLINREYQDYTQAITAQEKDIINSKDTIRALEAKIAEAEKSISGIRYSQSDKLLEFLFAKALEDIKSQSPEVKRYLDFISALDGVEWYFWQRHKSIRYELAQPDVQYILNTGESYSLDFTIPQEQPFPFRRGAIGIYKNEAANIAKDFLLKQEESYSLESIDTYTDEGEKLFYESSKRMEEEETQLFLDLQRRFPDDCCSNIYGLKVLYKLENCIHNFTLTKYTYHINSISFTYHLSTSEYSLIDIYHGHLTKLKTNKINELIVNKQREIISVAFEKDHKGKQDNFFTSVKTGESLFWKGSKTGSLPIELLDDIAGCGFTYSSDFYEDHVKGRRKN